MKKKMVIFILVIIVLFAGLYFVTTMKNNQKADSDSSDGSGSTQEADSGSDLYKNQVSPGELDKKLDQDGNMFVYYYQTNCSHCKRVSPVLLPIVEDMGVDMPELNLEEYSNKWDTYDIEGTPTVVYYEDGKEKDRISGEGKDMDQTKQMYKDFLKKHNES